MNRYKLLVEYCGEKYYGMQKQNMLPTIQLSLEKAIYKYCQTDTIEYSGRTDAGVHALGQVIHFDTIYDRDNFSIVNGINFYLQDDQISILSACKVDNDFHARFSVKKRYYIYKIINRSSKLTFLSNTHLFCRTPLDIEKMQQAADFLIGTHDFTSFRSTDCNSLSPVKTVDYVKVTKQNILGNDEITVEICAKSFLYNMVRNIVGTLLTIGANKQKPEWIIDVLNAKDRRQASDTAPAHGLYFYKAEY